MMLLATLAFFAIAFCALQQPAKAMAKTIELTPGEEYVNESSEDGDVYTVSAPESGYVYFKLSMSEIGLVGSIDYEVWSDFAKYMDDDKYVQAGEVISTSPISVPAGQTVELRASSDEHILPGMTSPLSVTAVVVSADFFELEPNDNRDTATATSPEGAATGIVNSSQRNEDFDWFTYKTKRRGTYIVWARVIQGEGIRVESYVGDETDGVYETVKNGDGWVNCGEVPLVAGKSIYALVRETDYSSGDYGEGKAYQVDVDYYPFEAPKGVALKSVHRGSKKSFTAKWKNRSNISGYQLRYSTSKSMKKAKYKHVSSWKTKTTVKKLKSKKRYYVQVRTYKKYGSAAVLYSSWSKIKSVKVR